MMILTVSYILVLDLVSVHKSSMPRVPRILGGV